MLRAIYFARWLRNDEARGKTLVAKDSHNDRSFPWTDIGLQVKYLLKRAHD